MLRRERERRGIPLEAVAETTKIQLALLAGLERGDLARWPSGIFRRAFVRAYADAVGLVPDDVVARFEEVFPERGDDGVVSVPAFERPAAKEHLRLTLAAAPAPSSRAWALRGASAFADALVISGVSLASAWGFHQPITWAALAAGIAYFGAGTALVESTPATWAIRRLMRARAAAAVPEPTAVAVAQPATDEPFVADDLRRPEPPAARGGRRDRRRGDRPRLVRSNPHRSQ